MHIFAEHDQRPHLGTERVIDPAFDVGQPCPAGACHTPASRDHAEGGLRIVDPLALFEYHQWRMQETN